MFPWDTEHNPGEEDENVDGGEASLGEGESQEEPTEESREDQNRDILDPFTMETDKRGMSEVDKSAIDIQGNIFERPIDEVDKDQEDSNTERSSTKLLDTSSMIIEL